MVVNVATFFTTTAPFYTDLDVNPIGHIHVSYVWPGAEHPRSGACSEGVFDHGGPTSIASLRDVVRYALGDLADIELKCGRGSVSAHKAILSARSPVFAAMFGRGMAEAEASEVTLEGIEPAVLRSLVHFLYAEELDEGAMDDAAGLLAAADQYEVPRLVALCEEQLCEGIDDDSAAARLVLAERHHAAQLKEACLDYIAEPHEAVMTSEGWQQLGTQPNLLQELFAHTTGVRERNDPRSG